MKTTYALAAVLVAALFAGAVAADAKPSKLSGLDSAGLLKAKGIERAADKGLAIQELENLSSERLEDLKARIPATAEDAEAKIASQRGRFLMWTHDLGHIMWGRYGNGYFTGHDNLGKNAWGIYSNGYFAGFYDSQFFYGKYQRQHWKAIGLFGEDRSWGRFVTYPSAMPETVPFAQQATAQ